MGRGSGGTRGRVLASPNKQSIRGIISSLNETALRASNIIHSIRTEIETQGYSTAQPFKIATISQNLSSLIENKAGIRLKSREMYSSVKALRHHQGGQKAARGKELTWEEKEKIPLLIREMDVYEHDGKIIFTDYDIKVIVRPNATIAIDRKRKIVANHISASKVKDKSEFENTQYKVIKKVSS